MRARLSDGVEFDRYALSLLRGLDRTLEDVPPVLLDNATATGVDGRAYRVRKRNNLIADHYDWAAAPEARQGTMAAYLRRTAVVPAASIGGVQLACVRLGTLDAALDLRLLGARRGFRVMLWPFRRRFGLRGRRRARRPPTAAVRPAAPAA